VVLVAKRREKGPVESRVGAFPEVFSVADRGFEGSCGRGEPWVGFGLTAGEFGDNGSMLIKYRRESSIVGDQKRTERFGRMCYESRGF